MKAYFSFGLFISVFAASIFANVLSGCIPSGKKLSVGTWTVIYDTQSNGVDIRKESKLIFDNVYVSYKFPDKGDLLVTSRDYPHRKITTGKTGKISGVFGEGLLYINNIGIAK
ncbi:MAG: hypothetical protein LBG96_02855 [Tannerella sp.]|jgi:hypothetical protein|nr:hypothetical protein [Tannerella sp.]